jgi:hypothetical protein
MAHITIEYMIMIPVLILQIFLFPLTATMIMDNWADSRRAMELEQVAGHLSSTIQQLYYSVYHASMANGFMTVNLDIPETIDQHPYVIMLGNVTQQETSYRLMNVTLRFVDDEIFCSTMVTLGGNVEWQNNVSLNSISPDLSLTAYKTPSKIQLVLEEN